MACITGWWSDASCQIRCTRASVAGGGSVAGGLWSEPRSASAGPSSGSAICASSNETPSGSPGCASATRPEHTTSASVGLVQAIPTGRAGPGWTKTDRAGSVVHAVIGSGDAFTKTEGSEPMLHDLISERPWFDSRFCVRKIGVLAISRKLHWPPPSACRGLLLRRSGMNSVTLHLRCAPLVSRMFHSMRVLSAECVLFGRTERTRVSPFRIVTVCSNGTDAAFSTADAASKRFALAHPESIFRFPAWKADLRRCQSSSRART